LGFGSASRRAGDIRAVEPAETRERAIDRSIAAAETERRDVEIVRAGNTVSAADRRIERGVWKIARDDARLSFRPRALSLLSCRPFSAGEGGRAENEKTRSDGALRVETNCVAA